VTAVQRERYDDEVVALSTIERRFGLELIDTAVMSMPVAGLTNPFNGAPTLSPLAILIDAAAGRANHMRCGAGEWTVSSELCLELSQGAVDGAHDVVVAAAHAPGRQGQTSVAVCTLTAGAETVGWGTVRSYFVSADRVQHDQPTARPPARDATLAELMAVRVGSVDQGVRVLMQEPNPAINNQVGTVHGGVASSALELAALGTVDADMQTASLRVNFLRPFIGSDHSRYVATPLRIGRTSAVVDAQAVNEDGRVAVVARVTAYR
jgi:uncharacterized protein (TIGR00369 family)